jgi:hypothetical protein
MVVFGSGFGFNLGYNYPTSAQNPKKSGSGGY